MYLQMKHTVIQLEVTVLMIALVLCNYSTCKTHIHRTIMSTDNHSTFRLHEGGSTSTVNTLARELWMYLNIEAVGALFPVLDLGPQII